MTRKIIKQPVLSVALVTACAVLILYPGAGLALEGKDVLKVTFLNVHQGDSELIQTPDRKVILIDAGQSGNKYRPFDGGRDVVLPFLEKEGIKKIDMAVATHPHDDHIGGLVSVLASDIKVDNILDSGLDYSSGGYEKYIKLIKEKKINFKIPEKGEVLDWGDRVTAQVIAPQVPLEKRMHRSPNNNSIVIRMDYGDVSFLFTGDCEHEEEKEILDSGVRTKATVLKVGHHGSETASGPEYYYHTDPEVVVISVGKRNKFDHPRWKTEKLFRETGVDIYRTDYSGNITITTDGKTYEIITGSEEEK